MNRSTRIVLGAVCAALAAPTSAAAAPVLGGVLADDLGSPLRGWAMTGRDHIRHVRLESGERYSVDGRALSPSRGGATAGTTAPRVSLSLDVRIPPRAALELRLGTRALVLRRQASGALRVSSGGRSATLSPGPAWRRGGWRHVQIAALDPLEVHVDGTRIPHVMRSGPRLQLRTLSGTVQLTGLILTSPDDPRALILHRLAEYHARTPDRRYPIGVGEDGSLRLRAGQYDGHYAGALWRAHDLTGRSRLFRAWAEKTTWEHADWSRLTYAPFHGTRFLDSSAAAFARTCPRGVDGAHRCRVLSKSTGSAGGRLIGMARGNPGTFAVPTVIWPNRCATCASADEVELRIDTLMEAGILEHDYVRAMTDPQRRPDAHEHGGREISLRTAEAAARLLVRADGSTAEAVRVNRLDGNVIAHEHRLAPGADATWARGHAGAIYGFARTGLQFERDDLVAVAERAAIYLESRLPPDRVMPYDLADSASPPDNAAGVLAAAGLLRLAEACQRLPGACAGAGRWAVLGRAMLHAALAQVSPHAPIGALGDMALEPGGPDARDDRGEWLLGLNYALEAIARDAAR